jgi:hypothetical protein
MYCFSCFKSLPALIALPLLSSAIALTGCGSDGTNPGGGAGSGGSGGSGGGVGGMGGSALLDSTFKAAVCVRDITPVSPSLVAAYEEKFGETATVNHTDPIYMAGFGTDRHAEGYNDKIWARGLVVGGPGGRVAIVSIDLIGYGVNETETARAMISPESGIDYAVISSTHSHEGPDTQGLWGPSDLATGIDFGYLDFVNETVADCIDEAAANLEEARLRTATAQTDGLSLGEWFEDDGYGVADVHVLAGDEELAPDTDGRIVNPTLVTFQVTKREPNGDGEYEVLGTLVSFANHPESLAGGNHLLTSDFPHYARERLEAEYGGLAIWQSSDLGVLQTPHDVDILDPETQEPAVKYNFRWAELYGNLLAERAISAVDVNEVGDDAPEISFAVTTPVVIPLANPYFRLAVAAGVINSRRSLYTDGEPDKTSGYPMPPPFNGIPQALGEDLHTEVGALRIGNASFAVVPSELDPQIGDIYRAQMDGAEHRFIIGLGNDHIGYQVPFAKWDDSCHFCFPYEYTGDGDSCPMQPINCSTVFRNNVGREVDPKVSEAMTGLLEALH